MSDQLGPMLHLTSEKFPLSAGFLRMLEQLDLDTDKSPGSLFWGDQTSEDRSSFERDNPSEEEQKEFAQRIFAKMNDPIVVSLIRKTYQTFTDMLLGSDEVIGSLCRNKRFFFIVSGPRQGGSYLTKELYRAVGLNPKKVGEVLAHDGHPGGSQFWFTPKSTRLVPFVQEVMMQWAEWLVISDYVFKDLKPTVGYQTIVKKSTNVLYHPELVRELPAATVDWAVVVRHPVSTCISVYEKSGGLPADGRFPSKPRSRLETWVLNAWSRDGISPEMVGQLSYFKAYLHYWVRYHQTLVAGGLLRGNKQIFLLPYSPEKIENFVKSQIIRFGVAENPEPEPFLASQKAIKLHPDWAKEADPYIQQLSDLWQSFGLELPIEIREMY